MPYQLHIPKPCHENWNNMTPTEKGAICSACQKDVIDYSQATPLQLRNVLKHKSGVCGRFKPEQLGCNINANASKWYWKVGLFLGVSTLFLLSPAVFSQPPSPYPTMVSPKTSASKKMKAYPNPVLDSVTIKGVVLDDTSPLPGVNVFLKGKSTGVATDFDGRFSIEITEAEMRQHPFLVFSYLGYETQEIEVSKLKDPVTIELMMEEVLMGEVVIVKQNIFRRIGNLFR